MSATGPEKKTHPRLAEALKPLKPGSVEYVVGKNAGLDYYRSIGMSDLLLKCKTKDGRERIVEFPECKRLPMIESYDEATGRVVIVRYWKDQKKNDGKLLERRTTYDNVPKHWTCIDHSTVPEYDKFVKTFNERQAKQEAKGGPSEKLWRGKKARKTYEHDMWNIVSVLKSDSEMTLCERGPLMRLGWGFDQFKHGNFQGTPENKFKSFLTATPKDVKLEVEFWTEAWEGGPSTNTEPPQNPEALLYAAFVDLLMCAVAHALFTTKTSAQYAAEITNGAAAAFETGLAHALAGAKMFKGGKPLSEADVAKVRAQYESDNKIDPINLLRQFDEKYMTKQVVYDFDKHKTGRFKDEKQKKDEIVAKYPKPNTERFKFEAKLFRLPTEEEKEKFKKRPYMPDRFFGKPEAYVAEFERLEAEELKNPDVESRTPLCPPTQVCMEIWKQFSMIRAGPRVMRMAYVDAAGQKHKLRELTWKEANGVLGIGAVASFEVERGLTPECKMNCASAKAKLKTIFVYNEAPPRQAFKRKSYVDDEPVPGAREVDSSTFDEDQLSRGGSAPLSEDDIKARDAAIEQAKQDAAAAAAEDAAAEHKQQTFRGTAGAAGAAGASSSAGSSSAQAAVDTSSSGGKKRKEAPDSPLKDQPAQKKAKKAAAASEPVEESPKKQKKETASMPPPAPARGGRDAWIKGSKSAAATEADNSRSKSGKKEPKSKAVAMSDDEEAAQASGDDE